jgi:hypothetical protein
MGKATVKIAEAGFNWRFKEAIPAVPLPGDGAFKAFFEVLHPFLKTAQSVGVTPMHRNLAEFGLEAGLKLPRHQAETRLFVGFDEFSLLVLEVDQGDFTDVLGLVANVYLQLAGYHGDIVRNGIGIFRIGLHVLLEDETLDAYLQNRIQVTFGEGPIIPDAVVADLPVQLATPGPTKLTLARSLFVSGGLYVEISSGCDAAFLEGDVEISAGNALESYVRILRALKLEV